jgi:hypothetical protein
MDLKKTVESKTTIELSAAERKAVMLMRELKPYQKIEIKLVDNKPGKISVVRNETLREDFPVDMS